MRQAVVVKLLADVFGISQETPTREERLVTEQITTQLCNEEVVVDAFNTLLMDEDGTDDEDIESDFGDDTALAGGTMLLPERSPPRKQ